MKTVSQLLDAKSQREIWAVAPDASVHEAVKLMAHHGIGAVLVVEHKNLVGIVSERDYVKKVLLPETSVQETPVSAIMTPQVIYVRPEQTIEECMALMTEKGIRHLPVMSYNRLIGVISIKDVVKALISEKEVVIEQLAEYITTGY
jgi:CBS domain-containing protein